MITVHILIAFLWTILIGILGFVVGMSVFDKFDN